MKIRTLNIAVVIMAISLTLSLLFLPWLKWIGEGERSNPSLLDAILRKLASGDFKSVVYAYLTVITPLIFAVNFILRNKTKKYIKVVFLILIISIIVFGFFSVNIELLLNNGYSKIYYQLNIGYFLYLFVSLMAVIGSIYLLIKNESVQI